MAISPRDELRILSLTEFVQLGGEWRWIARNSDGSVQQKSAMHFPTPHAAVADFFGVRGYDWTVVRIDPTLAHYSQPYPTGLGENFIIREYAYGAPEPFTGGVNG